MKSALCGLGAGLISCFRKRGNDSNDAYYARYNTMDEEGEDSVFQDTTQPHIDVFMSHDWGTKSANHDRVSKISEALKTLKYTTWLDTDEGRMEGNIQVGSIP